MMSEKPISQMTDDQISSFVEAQKGNVSGWRPVTRSRGRRAGPSTVFSVRFNVPELKAVQEAADRRGEPVSAFIRDAALEAAQSDNAARFGIFVRVSMRHWDSTLLSSTIDFRRLAAGVA